MSSAVPFDICLLTPAGRGAVAVLGLAGAGAATAVARYFHPVAGRANELTVDRIYYGRFGAAGGEEIVVCRRADDEFELCCHGGAAAARAIIDDLTAAGGRQLAWRAWVLRHTSDPIETVATTALAAARTARTADILLAQRAGALRRAVAEIDGLLSRGEPAAAIAGLHTLLARAHVGLHLTDDYQVVLAGRPNVGKSSLINALLGFERAIVYSQPGTTRDVVSAATAIEGWSVLLSDTAGLRTTDDPLEDEGIRRAHERAADCDLLLLVFDAAAPWRAEDEQLLAAYPSALVVFNKCDLAPAEASASRPGAGREGILVSALTGAGVPELVAEIGRRLVPAPPAPGAAVPFTREQVASLAAALAAAEHGDVTLAQQAIASLLA